MQHEIVIIGGGPAGIAAAIQLKRSDMHPLILEKNEIGGLLRNANCIENYPGFPDGISGVDLVHRMAMQTKALDIDIQCKKVTHLEYQDNLFNIHLNEETIQANTVIVASGTKPRIINDFQIPKEAHSHIYSEIAGLMHIQNQRVVIVGGGDAAFDYGLNLSRRNQVNIICKDEHPDCLSLLYRKSKDVKNLKVSNMTRLVHIEKNRNILLLTQVNDLTQKKEIQKADKLIFAIGREPCLDFISTNLKTRQEELISSQHLFFIGDVINKKFRQTAISVGDGMRAAMILSQNYKEKMNDR